MNSSDEPAAGTVKRSPAVPPQLFQRPFSRHAYSVLSGGPFVIVLRMGSAVYGSLYTARASSAIAALGTSSLMKTTPRRISPPVPRRT
jgi:hypothetical protein